MSSAETAAPAPAGRLRLSLALGAVVVALAAGFDPEGWAPFNAVKWGIVTAGAALLATVASLAPVRGEVDRSSLLGWVAFLGWGFFVGFFAVDPIYTWVGTPDRHLGLLALVIFVVVFVLAQLASGPIIVKSCVVALLAIGLYATLELLDLAPVTLTFASSRLGGPYGSPAYLAAAGVLLVPIAFGLAADRAMGNTWRGAALVSAATGIVALVGSQTRAGVVGLVAAAVVVAVQASGPAALRTRRTVLAGAALLAVAIAVTPLGSRVADVVDGGARGRIDEWSVGLAALADRPLVGAGFEGYRIVFGEHVGADYERAYGRQATPDRVHNGALDMGVAAGFPGLVLYLAGAVFVVRRAWRGLKSNQPWLVGLSAGVVGFVAAQQFLFPTAEVDTMAWACAGVVVAATRDDAPTVSFRLPRVVGLLAVAVAASSFVAAGFDVAADRSARDALEASAAGEVTAAVDSGRSATQLRPDSVRYRLVAAEVLGEAGSPAALEAAISELERGLEWSPRDPVVRAALAATTMELEQLGLRSATAPPALEQWQSLAAVDPNNAGVRLQLGVAFVRAGDTGAAETEWLVAADLAPRSPAPATNLARLYFASGRMSDAIAWVERASAIDPTYPPLVELLTTVDDGGDAP